MYSIISGAIFLLFTGFGDLNAQLPAFPGAEGWGKYTSGGRGGTVYEVTNLNNSGPGSLRDAVSQPNRIVVFRVSGNIELQSELVIQGNITIAGQTAPGDGICVRDYPTKISGDNVIIRYMRFRLGDRYGLRSDALDINDRTNIILDHCTMSWGVDECFSAYGNQNITVQWCIIGEALNLTNHSMGGLWGGYTSYHHNLIHTNNTRNPKYAYTYDEDITDSRNNVIYNWGYNSAYTSPTGRVNLVNNYYKAGPATNSSVSHRIVEAEPTKRMYITGNYIAGYPAVSADNWNGGVDPLNGGLPIRYDTPFTVPCTIPEQSAGDAYLEVMQHAGASFPKRDDADKRAIKNLIDSTGAIIIRQSEVGGFPELHSKPAPADSDHDGMPDSYETSLGLNPDDPSDRNGDMDGNGYTNIEDYINGLPEINILFPEPGYFTASAVSENTVNLSWYDFNTDELGFIIERSTDSTGFSVIDTTAPNILEYVDTGLISSIKYYYRIKSYNDTTESICSYSDGTKTFAQGAKPGKAVIIYPVLNQTDMPVTGVTLKWGTGDYTLTFDVYTGNSQASLELKKTNYTGNSYSTGPLSFGSDVFWRIDATNNNGTTTGDVWKFSTVEAAVPELVGYWTFNETDGDIVYDSSDYGNDGSAKNFGIKHVQGRRDGAISFTNSQAKGHIEIPDQPELSFDENPFSISLWMRLDTISDASTYILHKGSFRAIEGSERNGKWFGLEMRDGIFRFSVDDNSTKTVVSSSTSSFVTGEWIHVVIIRDVYKKKLWLYKNNILNAQVNDNTGGIESVLPLIIGNSDFLNTASYDNEPETPYYGEIDELVLCRHPFSVGEIDSLYRFNKIPTLEYIPSSVSELPFSLISELRTYPNPFGDQLIIEFDNGIQNNIIIEIYDVNGRLVTSMNKAVIPNARNRITWNGTDNNKTRVASGLYLVILKDKNGNKTGRSVVIKK